MTPEERQMLADLFDRVKATGATPRDPQAEAFINDAVRAAPFAPYVLAQTVLVQQRALEAAAQRIAELEAATRQGAEQSQEQGSFLGNLGQTIFGGGAPAAPPRPSYDASAYQRGPAPRRAGYAPPPPPKAILRRRSRRAIRRSPALGRPAPAERRRLPPERRVDRGRRRRRRGARQSARRPVRRPCGRRPLRRAALAEPGCSAAEFRRRQPRRINNF